METYEKKKEKLSKDAYDILKANGHLILDELKRDTENYGYSSTIATNFNTITEAIEFLKSFEKLSELRANYEDFTIFGNCILLTIKPQIINENRKIQTRR